jgi:hypothetical protein
MAEVQKRKFTVDGREYSLWIDYGSVRRVREQTDVRLEYLLKGDMTSYFDLLDDPCQMIDVITALVYPQLSPAGIDDFMNSLCGEQLSAAIEAFKLAFADFAPSHLLKRLELVVKTQERYTEEMTDKLEKASAEDLISGELGSSLLRLQERLIPSKSLVGES